MLKFHATRYDVKRKKLIGYYTGKCAVCPNDFRARRSDKKTCSSKCRKKLSRMLADG